MSNETNPYLRKLDQQDAAKKLFYESEWRLSFLRTLSSEPTPQPLEEEIIQWYQQNNQSTLRWN
jgi:hypothetical protein